MKQFYPRALENNEPLFLLRVLAGSNMHAGNVCHRVAPPGVGYTSPCHPPQRSKLVSKGCHVTAQVPGLVSRALGTQRLPGFWAPTCSACGTTVDCPQKEHTASIHHTFCSVSSHSHLLAMSLTYLKLAATHS